MIGDAGGHFLGGAVARHGQVGGEGGAAEGAEVDGEDAVLDGAEGGGDAAGGVQLGGVPLAVGDGEGVTAEAVVAGGGQGGGGIEAAAEQDDGRSRRIGHEASVNWGGSTAVTVAGRHGSSGGALFKGCLQALRIVRGVDLAASSSGRGPKTIFEYFAQDRSER